MVQNVIEMKALDVEIHTTRNEIVFFNIIGALMKIPLGGVVFDA